MKFRYWLLIGFVVLGIIGVATDSEENGGNSSGTDRPAIDRGADSLRGALADADPVGFGAVEVQRINRAADFLQISLVTPEGGFDGPSVDDLDDSTAAAFKAVYEDADWRGDVAVDFKGGLVDTRTGKEAPNERTGLYRLTAGEAKRIDWENAIVIDWSQYRVFAHPALKD